MRAGAGAALRGAVVGEGEEISDGNREDRAAWGC